MFNAFRHWLVRRFLARLKTPRDGARWAFRRYAGRMAAIDARRSVTYSVLGNRTYRIASAWRTLGLNPGDVLIVRLPDGVCQLEARLAAAECGAVLTMLSLWNTSEQLGANLQLVEPRMLVHDGSDLALCRRLAAQFPNMLQLVLHDGDSDWMAKGHARPCAGDIDPAATMALGFTSGTTGVPKILAASFGVQMTSIRLMAENVGLAARPDAPDVTLVGIPLTGAGSGVVLPTLLSGGVLVIPPQYDAATLIEGVAQHRVTRLFTTPSLFIDILDHPLLAQRDVSSLCNVIYGTETLAAAKVKEGLLRFGPILQQGYGSAEVLPPVSMLQPGDHMVNGQPASKEVLMSCGRVVPQVTVRVVNDAMQDVPAGTPGEVLVKSPTLFQGYWKRPDLTSDSLRNGFLHIGDMGVLSPDGHLTLLGRKPDMLLRRGRRLFPRPAEEALHEHPAIKEANYVQGPDGAAVMAFSLRRKWRQPQPDGYWDVELARHLAQRVPQADLPDSYCLLDELPRSPLGKVVRRGVREYLAAQMAAGVVCDVA